MRKYIITTIGLAAALTSGAFASNDLGYGPLSDMDAGIAKHFVNDAIQLNRSEEARKPALAASALQKGQNLEMSAQERASYLEAEIDRLKSDKSPEAKARLEELDAQLTECVYQMEAGRIMARLGQGNY